MKIVHVAKAPLFIVKMLVINGCNIETRILPLKSAQLFICSEVFKKMHYSRLKY